mmetsp:Transcript_10851/g.20061  ORF Transcript_10851/g.20061 Transcript_10851/m.20061 type:complete len:240 (-) Transcript_10851:84-803(-)
MPLIEGFGDEAVLLVGIVLIVTWVFSLLYSRYYNNSQRRPRVEDTNEVGDVTRPANTFGVDEVECPICMESFGERIITTNCGHNFDLSCFMEYCSHQSQLRRVTCPSCRQAVSLIFPNFDVSAMDEDENGHTAAFHRYNRVHGRGMRSVAETIRDIPELLRQIFLDDQVSRQVLNTMYRIRILALAMAAFLYLLSPVDLLPEAVFGLVGFMDDVFVILILLILITTTFRNTFVLRYRDS